MTEKTSIPREGALAILMNRRGLITSVQPSGSPNEERVHLVSIEYADARIIEWAIYANSRIARLMRM